MLAGQIVPDGSKLLALQVKMVVLENQQSSGTQAELEVPAGFRQLVVPGGGWPPETQAELVVPDGCRPQG